MSRKNNCLTAPALAIGLVVLAIAAIVGVGQIVALRAFPGTEASTVNVPVTATADEVAIAAEVANSPYGQGYGQDDYMTSPTLDATDSVSWYFGEGEATAIEPFP